jgi:hypothetical protein
MGSLKAAIVAAVSQLEIFVRNVELLNGQITRFTKEIVDTMLASHPLNVHFFLKTWFKAMLGAKDEVMVLINGEMVRSYHRIEHKKYEHDRGSENFGLITPLSLCSIDGIQYEYRKAKVWFLILWYCFNII